MTKIKLGTEDGDNEGGDGDELDIVIPETPTRISKNFGDFATTYNLSIEEAGHILAYNSLRNKHSEIDDTVVFKKYIEREAGKKHSIEELVELLNNASNKIFQVKGHNPILNVEETSRDVVVEVEKIQNEKREVVVPKEKMFSSEIGLDLHIIDKIVCTDTSLTSIYIAEKNPEKKPYAVVQADIYGDNVSEPGSILPDQVKKIEENSDTVWTAEN